MKLTICSSAAFYKHVNDLKAQLESDKIEVITPHNAQVMAASGDYDVRHYKTWYDNEAHYDQKAELMRGHFDEVAAGDVILVVNDPKHGVDDYIGGNVLMEMALAFYLKKPIYILHGIPADSPFEEEIRGMMPIVLHNNLAKLRELLVAPAM